MMMLCENVVSCIAWRDMLGSIDSYVLYIFVCKLGKGFMGFASSGRRPLGFGRIPKRRHGGMR